MKGRKNGFWIWVSITVFIVSFVAGSYVRGHTRLQNANVSAEHGSGQYASLDVDMTFLPLDLFFEVFRHVRSHYVEPIQDQTPLSHGVLRGLAAYFSDPLTRFVAPEEAVRMSRELVGKFDGIGAVIEVRRVREPVNDPAQRAELARLVKEAREQGETVGNLGFTEDSITKTLVTIVAPVPGGPADRAGLLAGDIVEYVDGKWVISYLASLDLLQKRAALRNRRIQRNEFDAAVDEVDARLKTALTSEKAVELLTTSNKPLEIQARRPGVPNLVKLTVVPSPLEVQPVTWAELGRGVGYVRVGFFGPNTPSQLRSALNALKSKKATTLVLDLRNCAFGRRAEMLQAAATLLGSSTVARLQPKEGSEERIPVRTPSGDPLWTGSLVVLVNRGTAGLSEVLAAALQEKAKAKLVGQRTAGDSMAREQFRLADGASLVIPSGKYFTPSGVDFSEAGLQPDISVPEASKIAPPETDPAVEKATTLLAKGRA